MLLNGGMQWEVELRFCLPLHTSIQQREKLIKTIQIDDESPNPFPHTAEDSAKTDL